MRTYKADLHIHTCLSPCAELEMSPRGIAKLARQRGLDVIGVCDHNSAENLLYMQRAAAETGVTVIPGMEVTTREEVHLVALFPTVADAMVFQSAVYSRLEGVNDEGAFGLQVIANEHDEVLDFCKRLLIGATTLAIEDAVERIHRLGGLAIASHVDREAFGIIGQLGFIPPGLALDAIEISDRANDAVVARLTAECPGYPVVRSSDAHEPDRIGKAWTVLEMAEATLSEVALALLGQGGRRVVD